MGRCRIVASQTISDISSMCGQELIAGWNAVWMMYQAVMIPLVSLFSHLSSTPAHVTTTGSGTSPEGGAENDPFNTSTGLKEDADKWRRQIETAINFFDRMTHWSVAAKKSRDVVSRLYEASKQLQQYNSTAQTHIPHQQFKQQQQQHRQAPTQVNLDHFDFPTETQMPGLENHQNSFWGLSPDGDAAMNLFWDHMQWDDLPVVDPNMPEASGTGFGVGDVDWFAFTGDGMNGLDDGNGNGGGGLGGTFGGYGQGALGREGDASRHGNYPNEEV